MSFKLASSKRAWKSAARDDWTFPDRSSSASRFTASSALLRRSLSSAPCAKTSAASWSSGASTAKPLTICSGLGSVWQHIVLGPVGSPQLVIATKQAMAIATARGDLILKFVVRSGSMCLMNPSSRRPADAPKPSGFCYRYYYYRDEILAMVVTAF